MVGAVIEGVDLEKVAEWMDGEGLGRGALENAETLGGGTQNILIRFRRSGRWYVLRRPPLHKRDNSDETMRREARVLAALAGSDVPHPELIASCPDTDVIGASFYLMEPIDGFNPTRGMPELHSSSPEVRHEMGLAMADGAAALGRVDYQAVGLEGFGKPEGFLQRQVPRWQAQLASYSKLDGYPGPEIPWVDEVSQWLEANIPADWAPGIIHGDYHLANVLFRPDEGRLAAIVDWELSTIGDPLLDLGWLLATWPTPDGPMAGAIGVQPWDGFPVADELVARYRDQTDRSLDAIAWYEVLACYKLGIILEGTNARAYAGKAEKAVGDLLHATTVGLFERGYRRCREA